MFYDIVKQNRQQTYMKKYSKTLEFKKNQGKREAFQGFKGPRKIQFENELDPLLVLK